MGSIFSPSVPKLPPPPPAPPPPPDASSKEILSSLVAINTMAKSRLGYKATFRAGPRGMAPGVDAGGTGSTQSGGGKTSPGPGETPPTKGPVPSPIPTTADVPGPIILEPEDRLPRGKRVPYTEPVYLP